MTAPRQMPPIWLDLTRLLTRVGRGALTGIDRVELAYLTYALSSGCERYLCRTTRGYLLLDPRGALVLQDLVLGQKMSGAADIWSRWTLRGGRNRHRAEAMLRPLAIDRCRQSRLPKMLARNGSSRRAYVNVGHANLSEATLSSVAAGCEKVVVMIHDLIPLTHPQFVVDGQPKVFAAKVDRVRRYASHVVANSHATADDLRAHWKTSDQGPVIVTAHLGIEPKPPVRATQSPGHFVMLGTIEPRKNHALMLDVWDALAKETSTDEMPQLHIIGAEGWDVADLMARIRAHPLFDTKIFLHGALSDAQVQEHFGKACGFLFPSLAEGYGFPPLEAAMAGITPICSNLSVFRETLGDCAVYVDSNEAYQWKDTIKQYLEGKIAQPGLAALPLPTWQEHFDIVTDAIITSDARIRP